MSLTYPTGSPVVGSGSEPEFSVGDVGCRVTDVFGDVPSEAIMAN